jgi:KDO2-lipid IV(A) lauroyltransferase
MISWTFWAERRRQLVSDVGRSEEQDREHKRVALRRAVSQPVFRAMVWLLRSLATTLGHRRSIRLARGISILLCRLCPWWRKTAESNLSQAFPEWDRAQVRRCAAEVFTNLTKSLFEFLCSKSLDDDEFRAQVRIHGFEAVHEAIRGGRPVIYLAAHYDNWEWVGRRLALEGVPLTVIARRHDDPKLEALVSDTRAANGMSVSDRDDIRSSLRALQRCEAVGILPDQNTFGPGGFIRFFGRPASTVYGPHRLWQRTNAAVFHTLSRRASDDSHDLHVWPMDIPEQSGDKEADAHAFMQEAARALEAWIREEPSQWLWIHKRWKRQPDGEAG